MYFVRICVIKEIDSSILEKHLVNKSMFIVRIKLLNDEVIIWKTGYDLDSGGLRTTGFMVVKNVARDNVLT